MHACKFALDIFGLIVSLGIDQLPYIDVLGQRDNYYIVSNYENKSTQSLINEAKQIATECKYIGVIVTDSDDRKVFFNEDMSQMYFLNNIGEWYTVNLN